ncbi:hypothetical protein ACFW4D_28650 [Paenibacillus lactis]
MTKIAQLFKRFSVSSGIFLPFATKKEARKELLLSYSPEAFGTLCQMVG